MRKCIIFLLFILLVITALSEERALKVAMILPGKIDDVSWNAAAYQGLEKASKTLGIEATYVENVSATDVERCLRRFAFLGYDLILAHSFDYGNAVLKVAKEFPNIKFGWAMGYKSASNVAIYDWYANEVGYLAGVLAAYMTKTGIIGALGSYDVPDIRRTLNGFRLGALSINPDIKVFITYVGTWDDPEKAKESASDQVENGADILYADGNTMSHGVIELAKEKGIYAIGSTVDQNSLAPDTVLTSTVINVDKVIETMIKDMKDGKFRSRYLFRLKDDGVDLSKFHNFVSVIPEEVQRKIFQIKYAIVYGKLLIPDVIRK
ncbi:MAG: BMP family protein [Thermotogae bacterium]|nr:BMP family protein [Thermotogota bacterium]